jgi:hypothetical protein
MHARRPHDERCRLNRDGRRSEVDQRLMVWETHRRWQRHDVAWWHGGGDHISLTGAAQGLAAVPT